MLLFATGAAKHPRVPAEGGPVLKDFAGALNEVLMDLALMVARDGEPRHLAGNGNLLAKGQHVGRQLRIQEGRAVKTSGLGMAFGFVKPGQQVAQHAGIDFRAGGMHG